MKNNHIEFRQKGSSLIIKPSEECISTFRKNFINYDFTNSFDNFSFDSIIVDEVSEVKNFHDDEVLSVVKNFPTKSFHRSVCSNYHNIAPNQDIFPSSSSSNFMRWRYWRDQPDLNFAVDLNKIKFKVLNLNGKFRVGRFYFLNNLINNVDTSKWIFTYNNYISEKQLEKIKVKYKTIEGYLRKFVTEEYSERFIEHYHNSNTEGIILNSSSNLSFLKDHFYGPQRHIVWPIKDFYTNTFVELATETFSEGELSTHYLYKDGLFLTEKTFKPLLMERPFILNANKGFLEHLHSLGFKTFDNWWDESYDKVDSINKRHEIIFNNLNYINALSEKDLLEIYQEMIPTLKHNAKVAKEYITKPLE